MRTMQWACYFHALAVAPRYPQPLSGRILGYNNVMIALLSDTLPYFLTALTAVCHPPLEVSGPPWQRMLMRSHAMRSLSLSLSLS